MLTCTEIFQQLLLLAQETVLEVQLRAMCLKRLMSSLSRVVTMMFPKKEDVLIQYLSRYLYQEIHNITT